MLAMSISEGRKKLFELRRRVVEDCDEAILTHKDGNVVLISMDQWVSWQETERLMNDKRALQMLEDSIKRHQQGDQSGKPAEIVFSDLL
ncbi:MAG TPA: type II toxin-antitoxin system prevent-host-death family antitoxin [Anaerolineae bacterium]|nr:type II toxin-antitoxin system prevent-host-death family antitoxin [Anaerolineae bacterium]